MSIWRESRTRNIKRSERGALTYSAPPLSSSNKTYTGNVSIKLKPQERFVHKSCALEKMAAVGTRYLAAGGLHRLGRKL